MPHFQCQTWEEKKESRKRCLTLLAGHFGQQRVTDSFFTVLASLFLFQEEAIDRASHCCAATAIRMRQFLSNPFHHSDCESAMQQHNECNASMRRQFCASLSCRLTIDKPAIQSFTSLLVQNLTCSEWPISGMLWSHWSVIGKLFKELHSYWEQRLNSKFITLPLKRTHKKMFVTLSYSLQSFSRGKGGKNCIAHFVALLFCISFAFCSQMYSLAEWTLAMTFRYLFSLIH